MGIMELALNIILVAVAFMLSCFAAVGVVIVAGLCLGIIQDIFNWANKRGTKHHDNIN